MRKIAKYMVILMVLLCCYVYTNLHTRSYVRYESVNEEYDVMIVNTYYVFMHDSILTQVETFWCSKSTQGRAQQNSLITNYK